MTNELYHEHLCKRQLSCELLQNFAELDALLDNHLDKLHAMIAVAHSNEAFDQENPLICHHYFWLMEDELERLRAAKQRLLTQLHSCHQSPS